MRKFLICISCVSLIGLAACSDDSGGSSGGNKEGSSITPVEKKITAAKGGSVEAEGAKLAFPAGALSKDLEITVKSVDKAGLPDTKNIASTVYDFGPDGTEFDEPVTLTLDFSGKAPAGTTPMIAWLDEDDPQWVALRDSSVDGKTATATTTHFTKFAVVFMLTSDGGTQTGGQCEEIDVSCGGDLVGTWEFSAGCATVDAKKLFAGGPLAGCDGAAAAVEVELTGTVTFNEDKTFEMDLSTEFAAQYVIPKSCVNDSCDGLDDSDKDGGTGVTEDGDTCLKAGPMESDSETQAGTYTVDGNEFTTTKVVDGGTDEADTPNEFCVSDDGKTALVRGSAGPGTTIYYTLTKK